jgi:hypothetical protein
MPYVVVLQFYRLLMSYIRMHVIFSVFKGAYVNYSEIQSSNFKASLIHVWSFL